MVRSLLLFALLVASGQSVPQRPSRWEGRLSEAIPAGTLVSACGEATTAKDHPWTAILWIDNVFKCGATILKADLAITAAHCVIYEPLSYMILHYGRSFQLDSGIEDDGYKRYGGEAAISAVRIHPDYDLNEKFEGNDIALLKLADRIKFNDFVRHISVAPYEVKYSKLYKDGSDIKMAGFGQKSGPLNSQNPDDYPLAMQVVQHRIVPQQQCNRGNDTFRRGPPRDGLCTRGKCSRSPASGANFKQICPGDSGSGIVGFFLEENKFYLVGVASYTVALNQEDCGFSNKPAFSINAKYHRDFIYEDFSSQGITSTTTTTTTTTTKTTTVAVWRHWSSWTSCSRTCGSGSQTRRRTCSGGDCQGSSSDRRICNSNSCPVGHTILVESSGGAAESQGARLGYFDRTHQKISGRHVYTQRGGSQDVFLYYYAEDGRWYVGEDTLGQTAALYVASEDLVPRTTGWIYWGGVGEWRSDDSTLRVSTSPPDPSSSCTKIRVAATGPAARLHSSRMGDYSWEGEWLNGRKIYKGGRDKNRYLRIPTGVSTWGIGPSKDSGGAGIESGRGTSCPCHPDAGPSIRVGRDWWAYSDGVNWLVDTSIQVTCV